MRSALHSVQASPGLRSAAAARWQRVTVDPMKGCSRARLSASYELDGNLQLERSIRNTVRHRRERSGAIQHGYGRVV